MEILVMRHGTTVWNEKKITQGRTNNRLSVAGKEIAMERAKEFKNEKIDLIFASPLMRTMQTANIMNQFHNVKIVKDERIIEIDQGIFAGRKKSTLTPEEIELKRAQAEGTKMEKFSAVFKRCTEFIEFLKKEHSDKRVLIVTHNIVASFIELAIKNGYEYKEEYRDKPCIFKNAELKIFEI
ncbi:MAG: histidine phosphatase family protein [Clostridia bacterium]|nr:histidine phosphatase family protein [Clostridia bacterium]